MLAITGRTLQLLRSAQETANSKLRQQQRAEAKPKLRRLSRKRLDELVSDIARIMKQGQPTPFAFEGACRHGVRSQLCMEGWPWADADACAAEVVAGAMNRIGLRRPAWWEGQPEFADTDTSRGFCSYRRCGRPIPIDRGLRNGKPVKYCCEECATFAAREIRIREGRQVSMAEWLALCAARSSEKLRQRSRDCANADCGKFFVTREANKKYCSHKCFSHDQKKWQDRDCANPECGKVFKPKNSGAKGVSRFCSKECAGAVRVKVRPAMTCENPECRTIFYPNYPSDKRKYCSPACNPYAALAKARWRCDEA